MHSRGMWQMNDIKIIRSRRKTISIEIKSDFSIIVRAPLFVSDGEANRFVKEKSLWIEKSMEKIKARNNNEKSLPKLTEEEIHELTNKARAVIPKRVADFADIIGVNYGRITIRAQVTRYGSCSAKGNLNFNCLLMLAPREVLDYVVVHELCHLKEMNHSKKFWDIVGSYCPEYKEHKMWLKENGHKLIGRLQ